MLCPLWGFDVSVRNDNVMQRNISFRESLCSPTVDMDSRSDVHKRFARCWKLHQDGCPGPRGRDIHWEYKLWLQTLSPEPDQLSRSRCKLFRDALARVVDTVVWACLSG